MLTESAVEQPLTAIRIVVQGDALVASSITRQLIVEFISNGRLPKTPEQWQSLTKGELECQRLLGVGDPTRSLSGTVCSQLH